MSSEEEDYVLPPKFYDAAWDALPKKEEIGGLQFCRAPKLHEWVVKLHFKHGVKGPSTGTGFYINVPDAECYIILTAGHNLIDKEKSLSENLEVELTPTERYKVAEEGTDFFISAAYRDNPTHESAEFDYGAIFVPKPKKSDARGFGFALKLGHDNLQKKHLAISGYRVKTHQGQPVISTGSCMGCWENQLEYEINTEPGLSGSPVYMPYRGHETVVAIHNNGPKGRGRGSKGTRLNEKVLGEIFSWAKVGHRNKSLKVFNSAKPPHGDLYLRFLPDPGQERGWVRAGYEGLDTSFDVFPAYAPPSHYEDSNTVQHVFRFLLPKGWPGSAEKRWVLWDFTRQCVTLTSTLQDYCFPRLVEDSQAPHPFWIRLETPDGHLVEPNLDAADLTSADIAMGDLDTPGVSFGKSRKKRLNVD
ncbi:uncharacterized protein LTHEOB_10389 [Lasiodiplodia theobromae]|uniref:uncharacterized protein n=1 Tax=Lasiodiplodia theobromae TaxID=45133 RepID=UPI0015C3AECF|nr:uncharacterized protein LTHEOB_10389 [Lasiodiplodia theobromae]KAF4539225.1 hypothetical protein LTHEOB_10389 [Lasiodiplodia theobromae]